MHCKTCDYALWNLKARQCPECGTAFAPSEFEFVINSVKFCCPHCEQPYYGTGPKGHLVPQEFNCVTCGQRIGMNDMMLRPAEGVTEAQTQTEHMPWLERHTRGRIKAWFATIGMAFVKPGPLMRAVPESSSIVPAWWFAGVTTTLICIVRALPTICFFWFMMGPGMGRAMAAGSRMFSFFIVVAGVLPLVLFALMIPLGGLLAHGLLRLGGPIPFGIKRTQQAICYSSGANVATAVPCVGSYLGWIWWLVSAVLMVKEAQRVSGGRASFAVICTAILGLVAFVVGYFALMFAFRGTMGGMAGGFAANAGTASSEVGVLTQSVLAYALVNNGQGPRHAVELVTANGVGVGNFVSASCMTAESNVPIADTTLAGLAFLTPNRQKAAVQAAGNALPPNTIAHRCGDFVFTYHGMNLNTCDRGLWIVIFSPDPNVNGLTPGAVPSFAVGLPDGTTKALGGNMAFLLQQQNQLRAKYNLPPLPDPGTITHDKPAVGVGAGGVAGSSDEAGN